MPHWLVVVSWIGGALASAFSLLVADRLFPDYSGTLAPSPRVGAVGASARASKTG
jgi:hypothetical protein